jgi:hypothetical protein
MVTETLDKEFYEIQIPKSLGIRRINRIKKFKKFIENEKALTIKKISKQIMAEFVKATTVKEWKGILQKHKIKS